MLQIAVLAIPLVVLVAIGLRRVVQRGPNDRTGAQQDDRLPH